MKYVGFFFLNEDYGIGVHSSDFTEMVQVVTCLFFPFLSEISVQSQEMFKTITVLKTLHTLMKKFHP